MTTECTDWGYNLKLALIYGSPGTMLISGEGGRIVELEDLGGLSHNVLVAGGLTQ